jgi:hypothetical protein
MRRGLILRGYCSRRSEPSHGVRRVLLEWQEGYRFADMSQGGRPNIRQVLRTGDRQEREEDLVCPVTRNGAYYET